MTTMEEFTFIAAQLEWLEVHLCSQPPSAEPARMDSALAALSCARAVINELAHIGGVPTQAVAISIA